MQRLIRRALHRLFAQEEFLLEADVAERGIAAKLAEHLAPLFPNHKVDAEYNRHGLDPKAVDLPILCRGGGSRRIFPEPRECDRAIIAAMKRQFRYQRGLFIDLPAGEGAGHRQPVLEWF